MSKWDLFKWRSKEVKGFETVMCVRASVKGDSHYFEHNINNKHNTLYKYITNIIQNIIMYGENCASYFKLIVWKTKQRKTDDIV